MSLDLIFWKIFVAYGASDFGKGGILCGFLGRGRCLSANGSCIGLGCLAGLGTSEPIEASHVFLFVACIRVFEVVSGCIEFAGWLGGSG